MPMIHFQVELMVNPFDVRVEFNPGSFGSGEMEGELMPPSKEVD